MKRIIFLLCILAVLVISGCATEGTGTSGGGYGTTSGHGGHHH